jgi:glycerol-3-phosphate acyltransferase PlsY
VLILLIVLSYLIGSVPFAYLLARRGGVDLRLSGSGNVGATNAFRTTGLATALTVMGLDMLKGALAVWVSRALMADPAAQAASALAAILGHVYPCWIGFRGGKGVATACGAFAVLTPIAALCAGALFVATVWWTRYVSLGSLVASASLGPIAYLANTPGPVVFGAIVAAAIIFERHRTNLARLHAGTERRLGQRA